MKTALSVLAIVTSLFFSPFIDIPIPLGRSRES